MLLVREKVYRFDEIDIKIIGDVILFVTVYEKRCVFDEIDIKNLMISFNNSEESKIHTRVVLTNVFYPFDSLDRATLAIFRKTN